VANIPSDLQYTADHEYIKPSGEAGVFLVGITDYAQDQLGDVVFVELPTVGAKFGAHDVFGTIEAVKAVSELFLPISGEVVAINGELDAKPALVNSDPYGEGWMVKIRATNDAERTGLLDAAAYSKHIGQ
jgi:glycine cleavage system H protein